MNARPWLKYDKPAQCPYCSVTLTVAHGSGDGGQEALTDGTLSICVECGNIGVIDADAAGGMRRTTPKEALQFTTDPEISRAVQAWRATARARDKGRRP